MTNKQKLAISTAMVLVVSACSSTATSPRQVVITPAEEAARNYSNVAADGSGGLEDAGGAIAAGKTLTARSVGTVGQTYDYARGTTSSASDGDTVTVQRNDQGELTVTIGGVTQAFNSSHRYAETDGTIYGYDTGGTGGNHTNLFNYTGELDELLTAGNGYAEAIRVQTNRKETDNVSYAIVGTETRDDALGSLPTATYNGRSRMDVVPATGFTGGDTRIRVRSDMTMAADFGAGEVSGTLSNFTAQEGRSDVREPLEGTMALNRTSFDVNGFSGTMTPSASLNTSAEATLSGSYSGAFYGPEADEVAGVLRLNVEASDGDMNGIGFFYGVKD